ncbi:hypothetical protein [Common midwife toad virus]|uniref:Uncharacterized protein n=2 Tax=Common midwife toad virus TaxID=540070 RepID=A0A222NTZ9_9VIRU|nr:hypothetical protein RCV-Z_ORF66 [Rana catesbeiana virus]ASH98884.1 hypothetical protein [Common midwife toad virus]ASQ42956.1 hypothetical protein [Rana esculenta virus]ASU44294.1 hypothetical protein RCV-Z_ORF66 [Rana catesbeiana virus]
MCYNIYRLRIRLSLYSFRRYGDGTNIYRLSNSLSFRLKMWYNTLQLSFFQTKNV